MRRFHRSALFVASIAGGLVASRATAQQQYELIPVLFPGAENDDDRGSAAFAVNDQNQVVGTTATGIGGGVVARRAFVWHNGVLTILPPGEPNNPNYIQASDVNEMGTVIGFEVYGGEPGSGGTGGGADRMRLIVWDSHNPGAAPRLFGQSHSSPQSITDIPTGINDNGVIVGHTLVQDFIPQIPVTGWQDWTLSLSTGQYSFLHDPNHPSGDVRGEDINNQGQVAGTYQVPTGLGLQLRAYRWFNGARTPLQPYPVTLENGILSFGWGLNEAGEVVGNSDTATFSNEYGALNACKWIGTDRVFLDPPNLPGGHHLCLAREINNQGRIVGYGTRVGDCQNGIEAFVQERDGTVTWLSDLIPSGSPFLKLTDAYSINENGWIVGVGASTLTRLDPQTGWPYLATGFILKPVQGGCYANCDQSNTAPILNVQDFTCFLQRFAAQDPYANCDHSTDAPVLNVQDFTCFLQSFAAGCP
jgi:hypothetical protein